MSDKGNCVKCYIWNKAAIEAGYASGMCEDCFNESYVSVYMPYDPYKKKERSALDE